MRADIFSTEKRAAIMRAVKSADTAPERAVRRAACDAGYARRYRLNSKLPGKPDLVFSALKKAVFVHGCFWHGHDCKRGARQPKDNAAYWREKIGRNISRDARVVSELKASGWRTLTIWECETRSPQDLRERLAAFLRSH